MVYSNLAEYLHLKYEGERAFILGNGPSLDETPLKKLESEYTFAVNKINKIYKQTTWRPSFFFAGLPPSSPLFPPVESENNPITYHINNGYACFLPHQAYDHYGDQNNVYYYNRFWLGEETNPFHNMSIKDIEEINESHLLEYWSTDASNLIYIYHSLYGLAQLVMWMGFDEIYFIGTDLGLEYRDPHMIFDNGLDPHRFSGTKKEFLVDARGKNKFITSLVNGIAMKLIKNNYLNSMLQNFTSITDSSHFEASYFDDLRIWDGPQFDRELIKSHTAIQRIANYHGINVYNATVGGELEVYPRVNIEDLL